MRRVCGCFDVVPCTVLTHSDVAPLPRPSSGGGGKEQKSTEFSPPVAPTTAAKSALGSSQQEEDGSGEIHLSNDVHDGHVDSKEQKLFACSPATLVVLAVALGFGLGMIIVQLDLSGSVLAAFLALFGKLWLKALKCIVLPMIVFSMIDAMVMMRNLPGAKMLGLAVVGLYTCTTICAALEGCLVSAVILSNVSPISALDSGVEAPSIEDRSAIETILSIFDNLVPGNLVGDAAKGNMLPVILASIVFGLLVEDKEEDGSMSQVLRVIGQLNRVVVKVVTGIMSLTPFGVGSLVFASTSRLKLSDMGESVGLLIVTVISGLFLHLAVTLVGILVVGGRRNPVTYFRNLLPAFATALGTSSSAATLPVTRACAVDRNGISPHIADFVLTLGATINMDGTSIYLICACYFLGALQGIAFGVVDFITMALLATVCSMGAAPVPSASLVLLATIMAAVGVPFNETFGIISAIDWMLDRLRTTVNVAGDSVMAGVVYTQFGQVDQEKGEVKAGSAV